MSKNQKYNDSIYSNRLRKFLIVYAFTVLAFALPSICPVSSKATSADFDTGFEIKNRQTQAIEKIIDRTVEKNSVMQTGYLEICKETSGTGLENNLFRFKIAGLTVQVLPGQCTSPIAIEAGQYVVEELIDGNTQTGGTFNGGFLMTGVRTLEQTSPSALAGFDLRRRTATVNISAGGIQNGAIIIFTNTFAAKVYVEICNRAVEANGASEIASYTIDSLPDTFSVASGACSAPILVHIQSTPETTQATGTVRVTQISRANTTLESASTIPADRFNSLTLGSGIKNITNVNCANVADPVAAGCTFNNPRGGFADIDVVEGSAATRIEFFNRGEPVRFLKICKLAGLGVAVGTSFTFDIVVNSEPETTINPLTIQAGNAASGGNCAFVRPPYDDTPFVNGISSFRANASVTVTERASERFSYFRPQFTERRNADG